MRWYEHILNFLLDNFKVSTETLKTIVTEADTDGDGFITMRELYDRYREWRDG